MIYTFFLRHSNKCKPKPTALMAEKTGARIEATLEYLLDFQGNRAVYLHFYCKPSVPV